MGYDLALCNDSVNCPLKNLLILIMFQFILAWLHWDHLTATAHHGTRARSVAFTSKQIEFVADSSPRVLTALAGMIDDLIWVILLFESQGCTLFFP